MLANRSRNFTNHRCSGLPYYLINLIGIGEEMNPQFSFSTLSHEAPNYPDLPRKLHRTERKPLVVPINELKRRARQEKQIRHSPTEIILRPPENGLLVQRLIPVAHKVCTARTELVTCLSKVMESIPVYSCRICKEVHVGHIPHKIKTCNVPGSSPTKEHSWERGGIEHILPVVESYHLYDRIGRAVSHSEHLEVDRIPGILELCIQAGVDIPEYPTRRHAFPIYNIAGRKIDFERRFPKFDLSGEDIKSFGFWEKSEKPRRRSQTPDLLPDDLQGVAKRGIEAWEKMRSGAIQLMSKYPVHTCGYCPEVQVGPRGHRARQCHAYKHQMRAGQHAWQEATIDDLVPPIYVWHVKDPKACDPLLDKLKRYYGMLPAAVEVFAQAGADVGESYSATMREDIAVPLLDEEKLAV